MARSLNNFHFHFYPSSHLLKIISFDDAPLLHPTIDCHSLSLALFVALLFHLGKWHPNLILSFQKIYRTYSLKLFWYKWCSPSLVVMGGDSDTIERFWARMKVPNNIFFLKWPYPISFRFIFVFSAKHYNLYNKYMWKSPSSIWRWDLNPQPSKYEYPSITTRPLQTTLVEHQ